MQARISTVDIVLVVASFELFTLPVLVNAEAGHGRPAAVVALGALAAVPLLVRRAAPLPVLAAVSVALGTAALLGVGFTPFVSNAGPALGIAAFTVADRLPRAVSFWATAASVALVSAADLAVTHPGVERDAVQLIIAAAGWLLGSVLRARRQADERLRAARAESAAEAERRIRAEERLRISADVHDVVSHTLSMIAVRSGVARVVLDTRPDEAGAALDAIETASRSALDELRAVLRTVRGGPEALASPSLADLQALVDRMCVDGNDITLHLAPGASAPPLVEESAYRVVQEALTNVVRHAGRAPARVEVTAEPCELCVSVVNPAGTPDPAAPAGSGLGLVGMRERVALLGGTVEAGPRPDGGFAVRARFRTVPSDG